MTVDFKALVAQMDAAGAFDLYPESEARKKAAAEIPLGLRIPPYAGAGATLGPKSIVGGLEWDIPQSLLDLHEKSYRDAARHYMPDDLVREHLAEYIQGRDFLKSKTFEHFTDSGPRRKAVNPHAKHISPFEFSGRDFYPNGQTMNLDTRRRDLHERVFFTEPEHGMTYSVCKKQPELIMAFAIYHAGVVDFLKKLSEEIYLSDIKEEKKERGLTVCETMIRMWKGNNTTMHDLMPAIALKHIENHPDTYKKSDGRHHRISDIKHPPPLL